MEKARQRVATSRPCTPWGAAGGPRQNRRTCSGTPRPGTDTQHPTAGLLALGSTLSVCLPGTRPVAWMGKQLTDHSCGGSHSLGSDRITALLSFPVRSCCHAENREAAKSVAA